MLHIKMCVSLAQIDTHPNLDLLWSQEDKTETARWSWDSNSNGEGRWIPRTSVWYGCLNKMYA